MALIMLSPSGSQESLLSLMCSDTSNASSACFSGSSSCGAESLSYFATMLTPESSLPLFSWSDFPCEGDDLCYLNKQENCSYQHANAPAHYSSPITLPLFEKPSTRRSDVDQTTANVCDLEKSSCDSSSVQCPKKPLHERSHHADVLIDLICSSKKNKKTHKKSVSFASEMEIRTYNVIMGDNSFCAGGMALQCGWDYQVSPGLVNVDHFENRKAEYRAQYKPNYSPSNFRLSYNERRDRLQQTTGMSSSELLQEEYRIVCGCDSKIECIEKSTSSDSLCDQIGKGKIRTLHHTPSWPEMKNILKQQLLTQ